MEEIISALIHKKFDLILFPLLLYLLDVFITTGVNVYYSKLVHDLINGFIVGMRNETEHCMGYIVSAYGKELQGVQN